MPCHATVAWVPFLPPSPPPLLCNLSDTHLCVQAYRKLKYFLIKFLLILLFTCFLIICCVTYIPAYVFDQDAASELVAELQGLPDFIIGNYSDGNLVSSLLAHKMGVTQVSNDFLVFWYHKWDVQIIIFLECNLIVISFDMCSVQLHMHWRKQNTQIRISIGRSLRVNTISHVSSLLIY